MAKLPFKKGGKAGPSGCVTPANASAQLAKRQIARVLPLGTGAVSTGTHLVGILPIAGKIVGISFAGQAAVTGTSITAEVFKRSADGNTATTLQSAATDIKLTASTDEVAQAASLTATTADLTLDAGLVLEVTVTATSITAGPGDLVVQVVYVPSEDSANANGLVTTSEDL